MNSVASAVALGGLATGEEQLIKAGLGTEPLIRFTIATLTHPTERRPEKEPQLKKSEKLFGLHRESELSCFGR